MGADQRSLLPSWAPGPTRDAVMAFLESSDDLPEAERFAVFDNDGTLWCERPTYVQYDFFVDELRRRTAREPELGRRPEFAAVLAADTTAIDALGLGRIALALASLFEGFTPEQFRAAVRSFLATADHPTLGRRSAATVYQPMLELIAELRRRRFTVAIVSGGGTEFVRAISHDLYGVPPELVVGTLITYQQVRTTSGRSELRRTAHVLGDANEGPAKVTNIQTQLGRRPVFAAGNSLGDAEMLDWSIDGSHPGLALLLDHDDAQREFAYVSVSGTLEETRSVTDLGRERGWSIVSMATEWSEVFPPAEMGG